MLLNLLIAFAPQDAAALNDKAMKMVSDPAGFQSEYSISHSVVGPSKGVGTVGVTFNKGVYVRCKWGTSDYVFVANLRKGMEIEHESKTFYEWDNPGMYGPPSGYVTSMSEFAIPRTVLLGSWERVLGKKDAKREPLGTQVIGSEIGHGVRMVGVESTFESWAASDGRFLRVIETGVSGQGVPYKIQMDFKPHRGPMTVNYDVAPPAGYVSAGLPRENVPKVSVGAPFPKEAGLSFSKNTLVIVAGDDEQSRGVLSEAEKLGSEFDVQVLSVNQLKTRLKVKLFDAVEKFDLMGTPSFWTVDKSGKVLWGGAGYEVGSTDSLRRRLKAAQSEE